MTKTKRNSQKGFTLLEMIVSITIFIIITAAVWGLLQIGRVDRNRSSRRSDMLKNARTALHLIGRDVLNAGLSFHQKGAVVPDDFISTRLGVPPDIDSKRDILASVVAGNDLFPNNINPDTSVRTDIVSFAYRDMNYNAGNTIPFSGVSANGSDPSIAQLATSLNQAGSAQVFDLYLVESDSTQVAVMATGVPNANQINIAATDPLGLNQPFNGTGPSSSLLKRCTPTITEDCTTYVASAKRFFWISYKVKEDGTLVRISYGNNSGRPAAEQIQEQPLAYNVQNLQFKYLLTDGTVTDNPGAGPDLVAGTTDDVPENFNLVRQITVTLQVQATEIDEQTKKPAVITLNSTYSVRNLEYDAG